MGFFNNVANAISGTAKANSPGGFKQILPFLSGALPIVGGIAQNVIAGINQRAQNRYNSPQQQVSRAKKAKIPLAATQISSGNQSSVTPVNDFGTAQGAQHLANYNHNQKTLQEVSKLKADVFKTNLENKKLSGELQWYLANRGDDPGKTNLSNTLGIEQMKNQATLMGQYYANQIGNAQAKNVWTKINLDNREQSQRIANAIQSNLLGGIHIEGAKKDNLLKDLAIEWTPKMNQANLDNILKRNDILVTEQGLKKLALEIENATKDNKITMAAVDSAMAQLGLQQFGDNYRYNKEWQSIVGKARDLATKETYNLKEFGDQLGAWIFTTLSDFTGGGRIPNLPSVNNKTFSTSNFNTTHNYGND